MVPAKVSEGGLDDECRSSGRGTADGSCRWFRQMVPPDGSCECLCKGSTCTVSDREQQGMRMLCETRATTLFKGWRLNLAKTA